MPVPPLRSALPLLRRTTAKHRHTLAVVAAGCALASAGTVLATASAQAADPAHPAKSPSASPTPTATATPTTCSDATLQGTYLYSANGYQIYNGTAIPNAYAGSDHFDGAGAITGTATYSSDGAISPRTGYTGTYTISADCTGVISLSDGITMEIYVAASGTSFTTLRTDDQYVLAVTEQRV